MVGGVEKMLSETILKLDHVTKRYDENIIFSDLSLEVKKGGSCCYFRTIWLWKKHFASMY